MLLFCRSCCRASGTGAGLLCCFSAAVDPSRLPAAAGVLACLFVLLLPVSAAAAGPLFASRLPGRPGFSASVPASGDPSRLPGGRGYAAGAGLPSLLPVCFQTSSCRRSGAAAGYISINSICFYAAGVFSFLGSGKASRHRGPISDYI